ncbi:hypothetical protein [Acidovorax sp. A1169]|uniref:hypothetical protein n=1 Tax=Acidovorax sp. A1169 TaxID=3059524 RepID=UPI002737BA3F|nr:hypothetical protein [Acidovorax sp. A1169]MDP4076199.1 hypothetical protein [Acidovorax sp. A1169]
MSKFLAAMQPFLEQAFPDGSRFAEGERATITVTMPKIEHMSYEKQAHLFFDPLVIEQVVGPEGDAIAAVVGNHTCNVLSAKFASWQGNNVQIPELHIGPEALDA